MLALPVLLNLWVEAVEMAGRSEESQKLLDKKSGSIMVVKPGRGQNWNQNQNKSQSQSFTCFRCGKRGHMAKNCDMSMNFGNINFGRGRGRGRGRGQNMLLQEEGFGRGLPTQPPKGSLGQQ
jgi:hypothetical protein